MPGGPHRPRCSADGAGEEGEQLGKEVAAAGPALRAQARAQPVTAPGWQEEPAPLLLLLLLPLRQGAAGAGGGRGTEGTAVAAALCREAASSAKGVDGGSGTALSLECGERWGWGLAGAVGGGAKPVLSAARDRRQAGTATESEERFAALPQAAPFSTVTFLQGAATGNFRWRWPRGCVPGPGPAVQKQYSVWQRNSLPPPVRCPLCRGSRR